MRRLTTGIRSEKCVVVRTCAYTNLDSIAYYTPRLYGIGILLLGYKPLQHVTVLNTVGNCNTLVSILLLPIALRPFHFGLGLLWFLNNKFCRMGLSAPRPTPSYPGGPMSSVGVVSLS